MLEAGPQKGCQPSLLRESVCEHQGIQTSHLHPLVWQLCRNLNPASRDVWVPCQGAQGWPLML